MIHMHAQRSNIYKLIILKRFNMAYIKYLQSKNTPKFECSNDEKSKDLPLLTNPNAYSSSFYDEDEDMLMIKYMDWKLRARMASASKCDN
jgi:hypothetical protein